MKQFLTLTIICVFVLSSPSIFALSWQQKGNILRKFKELEYEMLFESDKIFLDSSTKDIFDASKKAQLYQWIREKVAKKREFLEEENIKIINKIWNLKESIGQLDTDISNIREETIKINNQIVEIGKKLAITKETISFLKLKISENKKILMEYVEYLYKKGNYVYDREGDIDNLKTIIFAKEDISSVLNDLHFKWIIEYTGQKLINNHKKFVNDLYVKKIALSNAESESKRLRKDLIVKKGMMKEKKEFKEKLVTISQGKQKIYEKFILEKRDTENKLKWKEFKERLKFKEAKKELLVNEECDYVDFSKVNPDDTSLDEKCKKLNSIIYIESQLKWFEADDGGNILKWPIAPSRWISTFFSDEWYVRLFWEDHDALDIPTAQWTPIVAPADWYVILVRPPTSLEYSFLALKHSDWVVTVYGHLSETMVKEMDFVSAWEVFAKSWWAYGTRWSWLMTTWAHLHFEVWKDKVIRDPLDYMNISILDYDSISEKYARKYKSDFQATKWYEFQWKRTKKRDDRTFKIIWESEIERQKNFLSKYWVWGFSDWSLWVEAWIDADVDPTFLMCVWLAETSLWKHMKTPFNIWNVWNTDSWATITFDSPEDWVAAMTRAFNNRYLWGYTEIQELSRYWNKDKPIYASSPDNWHNNIVSCMSHIKWRYIPDDYEFRLK